MKLARLAVIYFWPASSRADGLHLQEGSMQLSQLASFEGPEGMGIVVAAQVPLLTLPERSAAGRLSIPDAERLKAERFIQTFANLLAVREGLRAEIRSPVLSVAYVPENDQDVKLLETAVGLDTTERRAFPGIKPSIVLKLDTYAAAVGDRLDGLALLAEALSQAHPTGQLHELIRVFERAFRRKNTGLVQPLSEFLATGVGGYTEQEVRSWILKTRHPATHADRNAFLLGADVLPVIFRIRDAAYDVLLNKEDWNTASSARRDTWQPPAWTNPAGGIETIEGNTFQPQVWLTDSFNAFYLDLHVAIRAALPPTWYVPRATDENTESPMWDHGSRIRMMRTSPPS